MMGKPGDIGLVAIPGAVGKLIRVGQWLNGDGFSTYEHAFVFTGEGKCVQAEPGGARHVRVHYDPATILVLGCPPALGPAVAQAALALVGTPYSFLDYLALASLRLHAPVPGLRKYVKSTKHMICSQLADAAAAAGGWQLFNDRRLPQDVTPGDLWQLAEEQLLRKH